MKNKKRCKKRPLIVYKDEKNDEFSTAEIKARAIDADYKYDRTSGVGCILHFFWYRIIAVPMAFFYLKIKFRHKIVGREKLKENKGKGFFVYGNHTQITADALIPTFVCFPLDAYVVVHANNVSMPLLGRITPYMGALPLPDGMAAMKNFSAIIKKRIDGACPVFIYPEAHIWPYYTHIRPFGDDSFTYPVKHGVAAYCFTNTYQKKGKRAHPRLVTYVDGPFYPDNGLPNRERRIKLRDEIYSTMCERAKLSDVEWIEYKKADAIGGSEE